MVDTIKLLSTIAFIAAAALFAIAIFLFFKFQIITIINDLTGRTARRSIAQIRENNIRSGEKPYRSSAVNINRGKLTEPIPDDTARTTEKLAGVSAPLDNPGTTLLHEDGTTELLVANEGTTLLSETGAVNIGEETAIETVEVHVLERIIYTHTDEVIP